MELTFYRQGFANNSSSSHSIIFSERDLSSSSNEGSEFGWDYFTCSSHADKTGYLFAALYHSFQQCLGLTFNYELVGFDSAVSKSELETFKAWYSASGLSATIGSIPDEIGYIDHQSALVFPLMHSKKSLDVEFITAFAAEFLRDNYVILGGNDNDDNSHSLTDASVKETDLMRFWHSFQDQHVNNICSKYDSKTGEFVVSNQETGNLAKIKFQ